MDVRPDDPCKECNIEKKKNRKKKDLEKKKGHCVIGTQMAQYQSSPDSN